MFEGAKLKIERANQHISDLEAKFEAFVATRPHRIVVHYEPKRGEAVVRIRFVSDPTQSLALIVSDAVHNIRVALDQMTWEAIGLDGGTQDRHFNLPTGDNRVNYESSCKGIKTPRDGVKDPFVGLEIFPDGKGDGVYFLHRLDTTDKHTGLPLIIKATVLPNYTILGPSNEVVARFERNTFATSSTDFINITNVPAGHSVEIDDDARCTPAIFLEDVNRPPEPVIPTLKQFSQLALGVVTTFETWFS